MGSIALPLSSSPQSAGGVPTYLNIELLYRVGHIDRLAWQDTDICEIYFLNEYESAHQDLYNDVIKSGYIFFVHKNDLLSMGWFCFHCLSPSQGNEGVLLYRIIECYYVMDAIDGLIWQDAGVCEMCFLGEV